MDLRLADPELKLLREAEVIELLNQPIYLRVAMINARDGWLNRANNSYSK